MDLLIADDDERIRTYLSRVLSNHGYECVTVPNGSDAVKKYEDNSFDCTLLDIDMPVMNGLGAAEKILDINPDASIIMVTGFKDIDIIRSAMRIGVFDYIVKPIETYEVLRTLNKVEERNTLLKIKREYHNHLEEKVREQRLKLEEMMFDTVKSLVKAVEAKDPYQKGHSRQVKIISNQIAEKIEMSKKERDILISAALVHDVGKLGIPDSILLKPGPLTDEEYSEIKRHPELGAEILKPSVSDKRIIDVVRYHHERYDGHGFPDGLKGGNIPEFARIITVADSLSAMISERPYRVKLSREFIIKELEDNSGSQFDPDLAEIALRLFINNEIKI